MAKALNLKVKDEIYKLLQDATLARGQSKTRIVEDALQAYLSDCTSNNVDSVDKSTSNNVDNVDSNLHKENSIQQELEARLVNLEDKLVQKCDQSYLDGLSCHLPETPPSDLPLEGKKQDKPYQLSLNEDNPPDEAKFDQSEKEVQKADDEGITSTELAGLLNIPKGYITNWKRGKNIPSAKSKYHSAYQEWLNWELKGDKWYKPIT